MTYADIVKLAGHELAVMAIKGELSRAHLWTAFRGASRYIRALAAGDIASPSDAANRLSVCLACPHATRGLEKSVAEGPAQGVYCGQPLLEQLEDDNPTPTCGCPVALSINGVFEPAAKVLVGSSRCPQGRW